jgi:hypothetical protein
MGSEFLWREMRPVGGCFERGSVPSDIYHKRGQFVNQPSFYQFSS